MVILIICLEDLRPAFISNTEIAWCIDLRPNALINLNWQLICLLNCHKKTWVVTLVYFFTSFRLMLLVSFYILPFGIHVVWKIWTATISKWFEIFCSSMKFAKILRLNTWVPNFNKIYQHVWSIQMKHTHKLTLFP